MVPRTCRRAEASPQDQPQTFSALTQTNRVECPKFVSFDALVNEWAGELDSSPANANQMSANHPRAYLRQAQKKFLLKPASEAPGVMVCNTSGPEHTASNCRRNWSQ